ncbi:MAG: type II secretion system major pseudopilin GspG [Acidobacteriota bacterium]
MNSNEAAPSTSRSRLVRGRRESSVKRSRERGITLIEMLVVVTIIALFVGLVGVNVFKQGDKAKVVGAKTQISNFTNALGLYKLDTGTFPPTNIGLQALRVKPEGIVQWAGPYMPKDVPPDPWGRPYQYKFPGEHGEEPDIISLGADGEPGGEGINADITSWGN